MELGPEYCDALWTAVYWIAKEGPLTTREVLTRCRCWAAHSRATRKAYLLRALHEAEELGLLTSRAERYGRPAAHLLWEATELGRRESADVDARTTP